MGHIEEESFAELSKRKHYDLEGRIFQYLLYVFLFCCKSLDQKPAGSPSTLYLRLLVLREADFSALRMRRLATLLCVLDLYK